MRTPACGLFAALILSAPAVAQGPAAPATQSTLRIELLPYDDTNVSLDQLRQVILALPPRQVTLPGNGTISALVLEEFGFGLSNLPRTYGLIEQRILALNGLTAPERAKPGPFLIPGLPSNVRYNPAIAWNEFPSAAEFRITPKRGIDMTAARAEDVVVERVTDTRRRGASGMTFDLPLTMNLLRDPSIAALARASFASVPSEPLRVKFGGQNCSSSAPAPVLSAGQRGELGALLRDARRTVPLFVIDTGWPSAASQKESWEHLRSLLQRVREHFHLGPSPALALPQYEEPGVLHCKGIEKALEEFRSINRDRVKVVYVPMSKEQGSTPLLHEMIEVADAVRRITSRFGRERLPSSVPPEILDSARKFAADVMPRVKPRITGAITETDKAVLESVVAIASEAARLEQTFHVVNESWAVATGVVRYDPPSNPMGLVVAAAGNEGLNINRKELDFAHRSSSGGGFVAVMNVDANGDPTCGSSSIDLSLVNASNAIGFSGAIPGDSATSYAAPRVGWLLAAAEAVRPQNVVPGLWPGQVQERIKRTRTATTPPSLRLLLGDPVKLVRMWLE